MDFARNKFDEIEANRIDNVKGCASDLTTVASPTDDISMHEK